MINFSDIEPERQNILASSMIFNSCWLNIAQDLVGVAYSGCHIEWGYADFEDYVKTELKIDKNTVKKLMCSYQYIVANANHILEKIEGNKISPDLPHYKAISRLYDAKDILSNEQKTELHNLVFKEGYMEKDIKKVIKKLKIA